MASMAQAVWLTAREFLEFNQNYTEGLTTGYRYARAFFEEGQHLTFALAAMPVAYQLGYNQGWSKFVRTQLSPPSLDQDVPPASRCTSIGESRFAQLQVG
jgi:hypothetical protein